MDRSLTLLFAVLLFLGGALAGRQIMTPEPRSVQSTSDQPQTAELSPTASDFSAATPDLSKSSTGSASSAESGNIRFAGFEQAIEAVEAEALTDEEIRAEIEKRFPDLSEDTLAGWIDAYRGSTAEELIGLLNERQMLKSLLPVQSFLTPLPEDGAQSKND